MSYSIKNVQTKFSNLIKGFKIIIMKIEKSTFMNRHILLYFSLYCHL